MKSESIRSGSALSSGTSRRSSQDTSNGAFSSLMVGMTALPSQPPAVERGPMREEAGHPPAKAARGLQISRDIRDAEEAEAAQAEEAAALTVGHLSALDDPTIRPWGSPGAQGVGLQGIPLGARPGDLFATSEAQGAFGTLTAEGASLPPPGTLTDALGALPSLRDRLSAAASNPSPILPEAGPGDLLGAGPSLGEGSSSLGDGSPSFTSATPAGGAPPSAVSPALAAMLAPSPAPSSEAQDARGPLPGVAQPLRPVGGLTASLHGDEGAPPEGADSGPRLDADTEAGRPLGAFTAQASPRMAPLAVGMGSPPELGPATSPAQGDPRVTDPFSFRPPLEAAPHLPAGPMPSPLQARSAEGDVPASAAPRITSETAKASFSQGLETSDLTPGSRAPALRDAPAREMIRETPAPMGPGVAASLLEEVSSLVTAHGGAGPAARWTEDGPRASRRDADPTKGLSADTSVEAPEEGDSLLNALLSRPKIPLSAGSFYGRAARGAFAAPLEIEHGYEPESAEPETVAARIPLPREVTPAPSVTLRPGERGPQAPARNDADSAARVEERAPAPAPQSAARPLAEPLTPRVTPLIGERAAAPGQPDTPAPEGMGDTQGLTPQAAEDLAHTERLTALRQERLPRIMEAMQAKISQMTQSAKGDLPARAVVDIQDPRLGRLRMSLSIKDSKVSVHVQHATPEVQAMLEGSQSDLQDSLNRQGLSLSGFSSGDPSGGRGGQHPGGQGRRGGTHEHHPGEVGDEGPAPVARPAHNGLIDTVI